ncbi:hypothetical protein BD779DRAFT_1244425 [Infundibulicybe gibba]|nr:hypothetical protein BD779DRAFT_1244425 [Infundibulicybe gibba]
MYFGRPGEIHHIPRGQTSTFLRGVPATLETTQQPCAEHVPMALYAHGRVSEPAYPHTNRQQQSCGSPPARRGTNFPHASICVNCLDKPTLPHASSHTFPKDFAISTLARTPTCHISYHIRICSSFLYIKIVNEAYQLTFFSARWSLQPAPYDAITTLFAPLKIYRKSLSCYRNFSINDLTIEYTLIQPSLPT